GSRRGITALSASLEAMHELVENTLAHLDPMDSLGLAILRHRFETMRGEFETLGLDAKQAQQRMRAYLDRNTDALSSESAEGRKVAAAESRDYAQDAILLAMIALQEAELATLAAILNKLEADQPGSSE
ncbi:MAG: hypothetical protein ACN4GM_08550, partial [Gammaproteobacteria bacterium]